jgi:uridine kinase
VGATLIGICGGSGSGKSRLAHELAAAIGEDHVSILPFDAYYKDLRSLPIDERTKVNFDHPDSLDADLFGHHLDGLVEGLDVCVPVYDFNRHQRADDLIILPAADVIIAEGILLFAFPELVERFDYRVFRSAPEDVRYTRRLERDVVERGRSPDSIRRQWDDSVTPMHDQFVEPSAAIADYVVDHGEDLEAVVQRLSREISSLGVS